MPAELFAWAEYALWIFAILTLFLGSLAVTQRYTRGSRDETLSERAARRQMR